MWCTVYKKNKMMKLKLVGPLIATMLPIGSENIEEDTEDADDSPSKLAFQVVNSLATNLPPAQVFPEAMQHIILFMQDQDPRRRKSAMLTLSVLVDGCADHMRSKVDEYFPLLCHGLQDPVIHVRKGACIALGSIAGKNYFLILRCS
jgi:hypothetical protein